MQKSAISLCCTPVLMKSKPSERSEHFVRVPWSASPGFPIAGAGEESAEAETFGQMIEKPLNVIINAPNTEAKLTIDLDCMLMKIVTH